MRRGRTDSKLDHILQWVDQLKSSMDSNLIQRTYAAMESLFIKASSKQDTETSKVTIQSFEKQEILGMLEQNFSMQINLEELYSNIEGVATRLGVYKQFESIDLQTMAMESLSSIEKLVGVLRSPSHPSNNQQLSPCNSSHQ
jgi:hypothetical protein